MVFYRLLSFVPTRTPSYSLVVTCVLVSINWLMHFYRSPGVSGEVVYMSRGKNPSSRLAVLSLTFSRDIQLWHPALLSPFVSLYISSITSPSLMFLRGLFFSSSYEILFCSSGLCLISLFLFSLLGIFPSLIFFFYKSPCQWHPANCLRMYLCSVYGCISALPRWRPANWL